MVQFVGLLDARGTVLEINQVALSAVGIHLTDVEGKPFWDSFWWQVSDEINNVLRDSIRRAAEGEFVRWDTPIYGRAGGKETIIIDASLSPVFDEDGKVVFICAEGRDITEKKAQEREIAEKNAELQRLFARISELDEIKTQFFANVSHELRTPLALILGPAERLLEEGIAMDRSAQKEAAKVIQRNAKTLLKHVNDLLDISKLEAGKLKIEPEETDISELVRFIASHFDVLAAERKIDFQVIAEQSFVTNVDPSKLQRVLMNLLSNAFKFVPTGGKVRVGLRVTEKLIELTIEDSGTGVKPELREAIFERFRQGDGGADRQFSGTGLGLAIARDFVRMHNGTISVTDSELGGALFQVRIPFIDLQEKNGDTPQKKPLSVTDLNTLEGLIEELRLPMNPQHVTERSRPAFSPRPRVLVVEDNPDMNRFIVQSLSAEYEVINAFDGKQGLEKALSEAPKLIVSDLMMPGFSGEQMIGEIRRYPQLREIPILLLSAKADEELKIRLLEESVQDFVTKPFSEKDLLARVRNLMAVEQSREELREAERVKREIVEESNRDLQARFQQLSGLFEQTPSFMAVLRGPEHIFEIANAAFYKLIGYREIIGKNMQEAIPEAIGQGFLTLLDGVYKTGKTYTGTGVPLSLQRTGKDSLEQRYVDFVYQPLWDNDRQLVGIFVEGHDVTEHKKAEELLQSANKRKDEFLATLAHELRNPLAPIRHAAMIGGSGNATESELKWAHEVIERQARHMGLLLDDLLDISRFNTGKLELRKERFAVNQALMAVVKTVKPLFEARGHKLSIDVPEPTPYIDADPVRIEQIFSNLLTNAAKYTDRGGTIKVQACVQNNSVVVRVVDNGIGISAELLPHLFELFSQDHAVIERSEGGLGIGLSLVRGLVRMHGGTIEARSEGKGRGSEFIVRLPLSPAIMINRNEPNLPAVRTQSMRVLVVDDNHDGADLCSLLFKRMGHEVRTAYSGSDALEIASAFTPQLVLLDIGMPGMNGYEVARELRNVKSTDRCVLIAVTGWGQEDDKIKAKEAGFDHHLTKPFDFNQLKALIAEYQN